ncbi:MAG: ABC transporter ATP-binding protein [Clostridia bacterium]|nr:ABC transporter ATP-binding protein [Clostridia bacterium]
MAHEIPELKVENLVVEYVTEDAVVHAVNDVSFEVPKGSTMGLVGETGAGKTTTALSIMKLLPDPPAKLVSGKIEFAGEDIVPYSEKQMDALRGSTVSMVFQDPMTSLNPVLTVGDQIAEVIRRHQRVSKLEARTKAKEMLELVGISGDRAGEYPHQFSGGMKQRVIIAIALACNPKILIADEPTTALDVTIQAQVLSMMRDIKHKFDTAMILITHDLGVVADICDTVAIMYAGRIIEYGKIEEIFDDFKHPYTEGLFGSLPNLQKRHEKLKPIKGLMPDPSDLPTGCYFHPRCKYATAECAKRQPKKTYLSDTHYVECLAYEEGTGVKIEGGDIK